MDLYFFGEFSHNGGIPRTIQVPESRLFGAETISGNVNAFRFLDIATYAFKIK